MIPTPNLDDRTFEDIVEEALRLIPQYCPEWTNFNPSDPGVTLVELFAWMTEMVIYRLNRVPDKNFLAFLDLMGVRLQPPQPARALLTFSISDKAASVPVRRGTGVATQPTGDRPALTFETDHDLVVVRNELVAAYSCWGESYQDLRPVLQGHVAEGLEAFGGARRIERFLYLSHESLAGFSDPAVLTLRFATPRAGRRELPKMLEWEVWTGSQWQELEPGGLLLERNSVSFRGPSEIAPGSVNDTEGYWIRGRLVDVPEEADDTRVDTITGRIELPGEGLLPDVALVNPDETFFKRLDLDRNFFPFDREPKVDSTFYLAGEELFARPGAEIRLEVELTDPSLAELPLASSDLVLRWEYSNGKRWKLLGKSGAVPRSYRNPKGFGDGTECLTTNGSVGFVCPNDIAPTEVNGVRSHWIRCRIERGNYGRKGTWTLQGETWEWADENPLRPPSLKSLIVRYVEPEHPFERVVAYNDFIFTDFSGAAAREYRDFQPFEPVADQNPSLYLGLSEPLPNDRIHVYFDVVEEARAGTKTPDWMEEPGEDVAEQVVVWEYWNGKTWGNLYPKDGTQNFTQSGFLEIVGPRDMKAVRRFGEQAYWLRARLEMGGYDRPPRLGRVLINTVPARNLSSFGDTILGSSDGTPNQSFRFQRGPVLDGEVVYVVEPERPAGAALERLNAVFGQEAVQEAEDGFRVRWLRVDGFFESSPEDRHYTLDVVTGELSFGDGVRGRIPPKGDRNVRCAYHQVGGGAVGNVPRAAVTVLKQNLAYIVGVTNHYPAVGGSDLESIESVKQRGPFALKARNRAVTAGDFEWLAREASSTVARVKALPAREREGHVTVLVVPHVPEKQPDFLEERPLPSTELLRRVGRYLDQRKLVTTLLTVARPRYQDIRVEVVFARSTSGSSDRIKRDIRWQVRRFLHPLVGGKDGAGWPFGRTVFKVDLFRVVEGVAGVDVVERIRLFRGDGGSEVEQVRVGADELVFVTDVDVVEKAAEAMF